MRSTEQIEAEVWFEGAGDWFGLPGDGEDFEPGEGFGSFSRAAKERRAVLPVRGAVEAKGVAVKDGCASHPDGDMVGIVGD